MIPFRSITLIGCLFLPFLIWGQTPDIHPLKFNGGLICGTTLSQVHGDGVGGFNKISYNFGATVEIENQERKALLLSVIYNNKGSRRPPNPQNGDYETWAYQFTYIDLPVVYSFPYSLVEFQAGLQPSVFLKGEENFDNNGYIETGLPLKDFDLSAVIGARIEYGDRTYIHSRLTQSIIPITPLPDNPSGTWTTRMRNMTLELGVTILVSKIN
ncbi:MAG: hypothetical protein CL823_05425 [Crocinitomicaceae bacterium]|mgnify:FL=1|nr:hypothetical protein [Crocinitomicaceae bacterium]|tara:strand:+ start:7661 stop:8299 length:639 start_codon:yes stop_codon:yes gene_type:complete